MRRNVKDPPPLVSSQAPSISCYAIRPSARDNRRQNLFTALICSNLFHSNFTFFVCLSSTPPQETTFPRLQTLQILAECTGNWVQLTQLMLQITLIFFIRHKWFLLQNFFDKHKIDLIFWYSMFQKN